MTRQNMSELVGAFDQMETEKGSPEMSVDFRKLVSEGLHHVHLPPSLQPKAAEALQLTFEAMGGVPRMLLWADKYPDRFYKLFARMVIPTITPVLPAPVPGAQEEWPPYITAQRLAYKQIDPADKPDNSDEAEPNG